MKRPPGLEMLKRPQQLRRSSTEAESVLWRNLRNRQLEGYKFRRQMWLCGFIADFGCTEARLIIEADGGQHGDAAEYDKGRSAAFAREGYRVLRFWNNDMIGNLEGVLTAIRAALPSPSHQASPDGPLHLPCRERGA